MALSKNDTVIDFTGERVVPGKSPRPLMLEHLVRYRLALTFVNETSRLLDIGCGTGYGTALLAEKAAQTVGVDIAWEAIQYARANYARGSLSFACADGRSLPFRDHSFDRAVVFEVIEHIAEQIRCLSEIRRVLTQDGILILSTPNPAGPTKAIDGPNPFHEKELPEHELLGLLRPHFEHVQLLYQYEASASSIEGATPPGDSRSSDVVEDSSHDSAPKYFLAVCSQGRTAVPFKKLLALGGIEHQVRIVQDLRLSQAEIHALLRQREENERAYAQNLAAHQREIQARQEVIRSQEQQIRDLDGALQEEVGLRAEFERQNAARKMELEWLYRWNPFNKLFHKVFYGKNLRRKIMAGLGFK